AKTDAKGRAIINVGAKGRYIVRSLRDSRSLVPSVETVCDVASTFPVIDDTFPDDFNPEDGRNGVPGAAVAAASAMVAGISSIHQTPLLTIPLSPDGTGFARDGSGGTGGPGSSLGAMARRTVSDVLGWQTKLDDPKAFERVLEQSYKLE